MRHACSLPLLMYLLTTELRTSMKFTRASWWRSCTEYRQIHKIHFHRTSVTNSVAAWLSGDALVLINVVDLRRARLVLGWVTVRGYTILVFNHSHSGLLSCFVLSICNASTSQINWTPANLNVYYSALTNCCHCTFIQLHDLFSAANYVSLDT